MNRLADRWLTPLFLLLVLAALASSFELGAVSGWIPRIVLVLTGGLLSWQLLLDLRRPPDPAPNIESKTKRRRGEAAAAGWILALIAAVWLMGLVAGSALFCLAWMRWHAGERWPMALGLASGVAVMLWLVFGYALDSVLPAGLLLRLLF